MLRGLYSSASGMNAEMMRQDVVSNNLANASTTGFKKDEAVQTAFPNFMMQRIDDRMSPTPAFTINPYAAGHPQGPSIGLLGQGVMTTAVETSFTDGSLKETQNPMDLAIEGRAMFMVELPDGDIGYTRAGSLKLNENGELTSLGGHIVLNKRGNAIVPGDGKMMVTDSGRILVNNQEIDELAIAVFEQGADLRKQGEGLWLSASGEGVHEDNPEISYKIHQGFVEAANVNIVEEMVNMITVTRSYEANQKSIQSQDNTLDKLINEVARFS